MKFLKILRGLLVVVILGEIVLSNAVTTFILFTGSIGTTSLITMYLNVMLFLVWGITCFYIFRIKINRTANSNYRPNWRVR